MPPAITFRKRAVSPVIFDSVSVSPGEIVCPGSEEEESSDEAVNQRRRRIEDLGTDYLEGRGLFIQSASLRGPFNEGWQNPWARRSAKNNARREPPAVEVPSSYTEDWDHDIGRDGKTGSSKRGAEPVTVEKKIPTGHTSVASLPIAPDGQKAELVVIESGRPTAKRRRLDERSRADVSQHSPNPASSSANRWLRKKPALASAQFDRDDAPGSPTPAPTGLKTPTDLDHKRTVGSDKSPSKQRATRSKMTSSRSVSRDLAPKSGQDMSFIKVEAQEPGMPDFSVSGSTAGRNAPSDRAARGSGDRKLSPERLPRLPPYVSTHVTEQATSAQHAAQSKERQPKQPPCAAPPSTSTPGFRYQYARRGSARAGSTSTSDRSAAFVDAPEDLRSRARSVSSSSVSSSDSSGFSQIRDAAPREAINMLNPSSRPDRRIPSRKLSFTASGRARVTSPSDASRTNPRQTDTHASNLHRPGPPKITSTESSGRVLSNGSLYKHPLPEAQEIPNMPHLPSGSSTGNLETEKQSSKAYVLDDNEDSYLALSTQAAITKAQRSFKTALASSPQHIKVEGGMDPPITERRLRQTPNGAGPQRNAHTNQSQPMKAGVTVAEEPLSTQAMIDDLSPFAMTTIKKRTPALKKRTSFAPSPTETKSKNITAAISSPSTPPIPPGAIRHSLSMSTSQSPSSSSPSSSSSLPQPQQQNPPATLSRHTTGPKTTPRSSALTSFSILPNGTFTETSLSEPQLQDGQQQAQHNLPPPPTFPEHDWADTSLPSDPVRATTGISGRSEDYKEPEPSWSQREGDLDDAIVEAGSFLGEWDVENEARKVGKGARTTTTTTTLVGNGPRSSASRRKGLLMNGGK